MDINGEVVGKVIYRDDIKKVVFTLRLDTGDYISISKGIIDEDTYNIGDKTLINISKK